MKKELIIKVIAFIVLFVLAWNLFDFLYATFISRSPFIFETKDNLIYPLILGAICAVMLHVLPELRKKK